MICNTVNSAAICTSETSSNIDDFWSLEGLKREQEADEDISKIIQFLNKSADTSPWEDVAMLNHKVKCLWNMWPRLRLRNGVLQRKFEILETRTLRWQIVLSRSMRNKFLIKAHGGMTGVTWPRVILQQSFRLEHIGHRGLLTLICF